MFASLITTIALAGNFFSPATEPDPRWQAWLGCWQPAQAEWQGGRETDPRYLTCVIPATTGSGVEVLTVENGAIAGRETIDVSGSHQQNTKGGCDGWQNAEWSPAQSRVYLSSEQTCNGGLVRKSNGLMSISTSGDWLDVRGLASGGNTGVRVLRYEPVDVENLGDRVPAEVANALRDRTESLATARMAAGRRLHNEDIIEASHRLDANVVEAWLIENRQGFAVDRHDLTELANAGVPGSVTDVMIALSYPRVFAINRDARTSDFRAPERPENSPTVYPDPDIISVWDPFGYSPFGYRGGYGYGGGFGWYGGGRPIIVVSGEQPATTEASDGQAVKGRGYHRRGGQGGDSAPSSGGQTERPRSSSGSSGGDSGGSSAPASSGSSGSGSGRTAHPRN